MRAGKMDRVIELQTLETSVDSAGTPAEVWTTFETVRAEKVEASTEEYLRGYGETDATVIMFRIRWLAGVTTEMRVVFESRNLNIREIKEIGRRKGMELRCEEVRT